MFRAKNSYIDETGRTMTVRLTEHKKNCCNGERTQLGIAQYTLQDSRGISIVIAKEQIEAPFTRKHHNTNQDQGLVVNPN